MWNWAYRGKGKAWTGAVLNLFITSRILKFIAFSACQWYTETRLGGYGLWAETRFTSLSIWSVLNMTMWLFIWLHRWSWGSTYSAFDTFQALGSAKRIFETQNKANHKQHVAERLSSQQHRCDNLKYCTDCGCEPVWGCGYEVGKWRDAEENCVTNSFIIYTPD